MADIQFNSEKAQFFSVLADGKFHHSVDEGTPHAVKREYETKEGVKSFKWELVAESIAGVIDSISLRDGEFGKQLHITFAGDASSEKAVTVSLNLNSNFAEDFLQKLPNIKVTEEVKLIPYAFLDEKGKNKRGMTVYQSDEKLTSYYKKQEEKDGKKFMAAVNGYPEVPKEAFSKTKKWDSDDWKMFFTSARKFLVSELEKNPLYKDRTVVSNNAEKAFDAIDHSEDIGF